MLRLLRCEFAKLKRRPLFFAAVAISALLPLGCALFLTRLIGESGVFFGEIMAWAGADLLLVGRYFYLERKIEK